MNPPSQGLPTAHPGTWEIRDVRRIWKGAPHCAFTDLARFQGQWLCVFREGESHISHDGRIRILRSSDGQRWESAAVLSPPTAEDDLRDPKFSLTPDGELMLNAGLTNRESRPPKRASVAWFSKDGISWRAAAPDASSGDTWRWQVAWHDGRAYGVGYGGRDAGGCLYRSDDGARWEAFKRPFFPTLMEGDWTASESSLAFQDNGMAFCLTRRDPTQPTDLPLPSAWIGHSAPPYEHWTWRDLGQRVGGPLLFRLRDGRWIIIGRTYGPRRTTLLEVDLAIPRILRTLPLPSGGDTSYAGAVEHEGRLWISYYSSHEVGTAIYLAQVQIPPKDF